jgi:NodT family efflux transporter outer membrane factor (OMF) lipoprotein
MKAKPALLISVLLCECTVGPRYVPPAVTAPAAFKESAPAAYSAGLPGAWQPARPQDAVIKGKWWEIFNEPELNTLEEQLDIDNQNIAQYFQNFMASRDQVREARSAYFPTVTVNPTLSKAGAPFANSNATNFSASPGTITGVTSPGSTATTASSAVATTTTGFALPFDVSWEPDLWGRVRNTVREAQYAAQVSAADLENERLTEQAALAAFYFELRGQDSLQSVNNRLVEAARQSLELTRALVETGIDSPEDLAESEVTLANAQEAAVGVATNRAIYEHAIAMLIGKPASSFSLSVKLLTTPVPPIPVGVPSALLQRRPDIAAAERTMAEANALIGVEKAAYYPTVSLTGGGGLQGSSLASLFSVPGIFWALGASASGTIFDAGLRKATVAQYTAAFNADVAAYKQTVLTAFQQVEDYIATLRVVSQQIIRQQEALKAAQQYVSLETARYETGIDPYLDVLTAQITLLTNEQTEVSLRVSEMTAAVQLVQALGGGWNVGELPAASKITTTGAARQAAEIP